MNGWCWGPIVLSLYLSRSRSVARCLRRTPSWLRRSLTSPKLYQSTRKSTKDQQQLLTSIPSSSADPFCSNGIERKTTPHHGPSSSQLVGVLAPQISVLSPPPPMALPPPNYSESQLLFQAASLQKASGNGNNEQRNTGRCCCEQHTAGTTR